MHALQNMLDLRGTAVDKDLAVDANVILGKSVDESVLEERLRNSYKDGTTEGLEELHTGRTHGDHLLGKNGLHDEHTDLETGTDTETSNHLVAEPFAQRGINVERGNHAGADCEEDHARDDDVVVVADGRDETA